jgi:AraC-like DNA-binding protein
MNNEAATQFYTPHPALQPYVQGYLYAGMWAVYNQTASLNIYPVEYTAMSFVLDEQHQFRETGTNAVYSCPLCFVGLLDHGRSFDVFPKRLVQVIFKPYGAFKVFGIPQRYFSNEATDLDLLFPEIKTFTEQLKEADGSADKIVALLENWLLKRLATNVKTNVNGVAYACEQIKKSKGLLRIEELSSDMGMSTTTLGDQFRDKVGFSPKAFSRIVRFNNINNFISQHHSINWQELVYTFGFFDQNHFIKEFRRFYGCTPSEWHARQSPG